MGIFKDNQLNFNRVIWEVHKPSSPPKTEKRPIWVSFFYAQMSTHLTLFLLAIVARRTSHCFCEYSTEIKRIIKSN